MMSKHLEDIIRKFINEQARPKLVKQAERLDQKGVQFIKSNVCPKLGINPNEVDSMDRIYGLRVVINRKGEVTPTGEISDTSKYDESQLQQDVLNYLDTSIGGVWAKAKGTGWYWFLSTDQSKQSSTKDERRRATYSVICTYVNASLISKLKRMQISSSTKGWIKTFKTGGLVFDLNSIVENEWQVKIKDPAEKPELLSIGDTPKQPETSTTTTNQGVPVLDLTPDKISNEILNSIIVPDGGFKVGLKDDNEFYKVQVLMLRFAESIGSVENKAWYNNVKNALNTKENRGDFWDGMPVLKKLGGTQQIISVIKNHLKYKDLNPDIVTSDFIDLLRTKLK
jgi:hypothetical protein